MAANVTLQTIAVTPASKTILVGQKQAFKATGTFSDGSTHVLGPDLSNMALGANHSCALLRSGGVECWGQNDAGALGDGTTANSLIPRPVKGITTATALATSQGNVYGHSCALLASGAVRCWGLRTAGQLGNGNTNAFSDIPVAVRGISTATAVAAGGEHSCALLTGGAVQCWGDNSWGQLGDGSSTEYSSTPVPVTGISTATALALAGQHSCALLASGAVRCWGNNAYGQLGNGTTTDSNTPVTVHGIGSATVVAGGGEFSCALLASGAVQCWGSNYWGQLGNGSSTEYSSIPVPVTGISTAVAVIAGGYHACAALRSGSVKCWGLNLDGQLGDGTSTLYSNIPVLVRSINSPTKLAGGDADTCALFSGGMMRCWGYNGAGQLGDRRKISSRLPVTVVGTPGVVWTSSNLTKATITDRGVATGRAAGSTTISATTAGFINDNAVLTVK